MSIVLSIAELPKLTPPAATILVAQNERSSAKWLTLQQTPQLIVQERGGARETFEIPVLDQSETETAPVPIESVDVIEVIADRQVYDESTQVVTAEGNVVMRFAEAVLTSDRIQINLADRIAVAQGNVTLTRGETNITRFAI